MTITPDHFHCIYKLPDGTQAEIEGGITHGDIEKLTALTTDEYTAWKQEAALSWGMPADGEIMRVWFAG